MEFLVDDVLLTNLTAPPYTAGASGLTSGAYVIEVIAADTNGFLATNSVQVLGHAAGYALDGAAITFSNSNMLNQ